MDLYNYGKIGGLEDEFSRYTYGERALAAGGKGFSIASGMSPWNVAHKQLSAMIVAARIFDNAESAFLTGRFLNDADAVRMRESGIDIDIATRIWKAFDESTGERIGPKGSEIYIPHALEWNDEFARMAFTGAVSRDVDRIIVTPGQELPFFISTPTKSSHIFF